MPTSKTEPMLQAFHDHVAELAETWYEKDEPKAFRHAAFQMAVPDPNIADTQVIELTAIDKTGDLEIDGWFVDDTDESILLFQSQGGKGRANEAKVAKFWEAPQELLDPERVAASPNQSVKELSKQLDGLLRSEYSIRLVFASRGGFEPAAKGFARPKSRSERVFTLGDSTEVICNCSLELLTEHDLAQKFEDYRSGFRGGGDTDVELALEQTMMHEVGTDGLKSLRATVRASEIVRIFKTPSIGYRLFSLNPRGPLANAKVNKNIERTLDSEKGRREFHLLNNGLCATCDDFHLEEGTLKIKNFLIVNGCQTTVTLEKRSDTELRQTLVDLKLTVADRSLAEQIAIASNQQTALKVRDYAAFEKQQLVLQYEFEREVRSPWFYEVKQGYWRFVLTDREKAKFKMGRTKRHIEVQPLAQSSLAFLGFPDEALDRVRFVFEGIRNPEERKTYERAFPPGVKAQQLLLPWRMLDHLERTTEERPRFSTFHVIWLSADFLRGHYGLESRQFFSPSTTNKLLDSLENWLPPLVRISSRACRTGYRRAQNIAGGAGSLDLRDFFRAPGALAPGIDPKELLQEAFREENGDVEEDRNPVTFLPS